MQYKAYYRNGQYIVAANIAADLLDSIWTSLSSYVSVRGTGIRGLTRGMATVRQGNRELLVVRDKVGRPQVSLG